MERHLGATSATLRFAAGHCLLASRSKLRPGAASSCSLDGHALQRPYRHIFLPDNTHSK
jgi:hypothetical protein